MKLLSIILITLIFQSCSRETMESFVEKEQELYKSKDICAQVKHVIHSDIQKQKGFDWVRFGMLYSNFIKKNHYDFFDKKSEKYVDLVYALMSNHPRDWEKVGERPDKINRFNYALYKAGLFYFGTKPPNEIVDLKLSAKILKQLTKEDKDNGAVDIFLALVQSRMDEDHKNVYPLLKSAVKKKNFQIYNMHMMQLVLEKGLSDPNLLVPVIGIQSVLKVPSFRELTAFIKKSVDSGDKKFNREFIEYTTKMMQKHKEKSHLKEMVFWSALEYSVLRSWAHKAVYKLHAFKEKDPKTKRLTYRYPSQADERLVVSFSQTFPPYKQIYGEEIHKNWIETFNELAENKSGNCDISRLKYMMEAEKKSLSTHGFSM